MPASPGRLHRLRRRPFTMADHLRGRHPSKRRASWARLSGWIVVWPRIRSRTADLRRDMASRSQIITRRSGSGNGRGRNNVASTSAKMALLAPMPSATVSTTITVKASERLSCRVANFTSPGSSANHRPSRMLVVSHSTAPTDRRNATTDACLPCRAMPSGVRHSPASRLRGAQTRALTFAPRETSCLTTSRCPRRLA